MTHLDADAVTAIFDAPAPLTVGIEEELMLLDPQTLDLAPLAQELLERTEGDGRFKMELPKAQLEIASPALRSAAGVREFLAKARADLTQAARGLVRLGCSGVHPFAAEEGEVNDAERYRRSIETYGPLTRRQLVFGLQVHVAVRGAERALAVYNGLRNRLPELLALAANSPFYRGADTGFASIRPKLCELLPRQGVPPALASWDDYADALRWGAKAGGVHDPGVWWWELRPHPSWGTLEVRVPDAQITVDDAAALAAVVHALASWLGERHDDGRTEPAAPTWRIEENRWQAIRDGPGGELADLESGERMPTRERLERLLAEIEPAARTLCGASELAHAHGLLTNGGAVRQRAAYAERGMRGVSELLVTGFEGHPTGNA